MLIIDMEEIHRLVPPSVRRDLSGEQEQVVQKLLSVYPTDMPSLLYYIVKERPDLIADREAGKLKEDEASQFIGLRVNVRNAAYGQQEFGNKMLFGEADLFGGHTRSGLKATADALAKMVESGVNAVSLFRSKDARRAFRQKNNLPIAFRPGNGRPAARNPKPGQGTGES